ncbi:hypothetical protein CPB85DRAFT_1019110 [Mucidula mucida]|nr:hypothetical protein CPB85DRAFT_1019110 [Mucidula mucida]
MASSNHQLSDASPDAGRLMKSTNDLSMLITAEGSVYFTCSVQFQLGTSDNSVCTVTRPSSS